MRELTPHSLCSLPPEDTEIGAHLHPGSGPSPDPTSACPCSWVSGLQNCEDQCLLGKPPGLWCLLWQPGPTQTGRKLGREDSQPGRAAGRASSRCQDPLSALNRRALWVLSGLQSSPLRLHVLTLLLAVAGPALGHNRSPRWPLTSRCFSDSFVREMPPPSGAQMFLLHSSLPGPSGNRLDKSLPFSV